MKPCNTYGLHLSFLQTLPTLQEGGRTNLTQSKILQFCRELGCCKLQLDPDVLLNFKEIVQQDFLGLTSAYIQLSQASRNIWLWRWGTDHASFHFFSYSICLSGTITTLKPRNRTDHNGNCINTALCCMLYAIHPCYDFFSATLFNLREQFELWFVSYLLYTKKVIEHSCACFFRYPECFFAHQMDASRH